mgnify:CR=1 FL=1
MKKIIPPVIITLILIIFYLLYFWGHPYRGTYVFKVTEIIVPLALIGVSIFVLIERIKEIRGGEEDDLSKY